MHSRERLLPVPALEIAPVTVSHDPRAAKISSALPAWCRVLLAQQRSNPPSRGYKRLK